VFAEMLCCALQSLSPVFHQKPAGGEERKRFPANKRRHSRTSVFLGLKLFGLPFTR
jgi:hypothetical protein